MTGWILGKLSNHMCTESPEEPTWESPLMWFIRNRQGASFGDSVDLLYLALVQGNELHVYLRSFPALAFPDHFSSFIYFQFLFSRLTNHHMVGLLENGSFLY